jgi:Zn-dependent protease
MKGSIKICEIFGIAIKVHITFVLLPLIFSVIGGLKGLFVILAVFVVVTIHELCHSLVAKKHGVTVKEITLLPIGGIASMGSLPEKPQQELEISIAGPLFNILVAIVFFLPLYNILGPKILFAPSLETWPRAFAYLFWINLALAMFNLLPAFPMDGGRILRSFLAQRIGYLRATKIAVNFGHVFALIFGVIGLTSQPPHILLIIIAIFIYMAASGEEMQVELKEVLRKFRVRDILPRQVLTLSSDATLSKVLEVVFHSHQEDFPIMTESKLVGFLTRQDIVANIHKYGTAKAVAEVMRKDFPTVRETDSLITVQKVMQQHGIKAVPVLKNGTVCGVISLEDIGRVYSMLSARK